MSLYVKLFTNFWTHRKTMRLRALIGDDAFWIPPRLWSYAAENQADGDFSNYEPGEFALLIGYLKDATSMLQALQKAGFLDGMKIHGWEDHNEYHKTFAERAKTAAAARWEKERSKEKGDEKKGQDRSQALHQASLSNASSINHSGTKAKPGCLEEVLEFCKSANVPDGEYFWEKWNGNGFKNAGKAMNCWKSTIRSWKAAGHLPSQKNSGNGKKPEMGLHGKIRMVD